MTQIRYEGEWYAVQEGDHTYRLYRFHVEGPVKEGQVHAPQEVVGRIIHTLNELG